jgi:excisionase family DNA binding protein
MKTTPNYLNIAGAAQYLGCSKSTMERMLRHKLIPYRKVGRRVYINPDEMMRALEGFKSIARRTSK